MINVDVDYAVIWKSVSYGYVFKGAVFKDCCPAVRGKDHPALIVLLNVHHRIVKQSAACVVLLVRLTVKSNNTAVISGYPEVSGGLILVNIPNPFKGKHIIRNCSEGSIFINTDTVSCANPKPVAAVFSNYIGFIINKAVCLAEMLKICSVKFMNASSICYNPYVSKVIFFEPNHHIVCQTGIHTVVLKKFTKKHVCSSSQSSKPNIMLPVDHRFIYYFSIQSIF